MELKLYNTLTRDEDPPPFKPINPKNVRIYVCGPTVYDLAHIGNARPLIVFDVLFRLLKHLAKEGAWDGGKGRTKVTYIRNITDVDDKINDRAAERFPDLPLNKAIRLLTKQTTEQFWTDVKELGCLKPTREPRATRHIDEMKKLIRRLLKNQCAYAAEDHVLFSVSAFKEYGRLSNRSLDEMLAGARVEVAPYKRDPMDFVLWKPSNPGEPSWRSPPPIKRRGRPGWHLECSAMSWKHLGETFDIHGGGIDLVFPHHENEIAQSRCAFHTPLMAQIWMHNGFLQVEGEKMAKSAGNFVTIRELFESWQGRKWRRPEIRLLMMSTHYRQPIDWTLHALDEAYRTVTQWEKLTADVDYRRVKISPSPKLLSSLCRDLNTVEAIHELRSTASLANTDRNAATRLYCDLVFLGIFADRKEQDRKLRARLRKIVERGL
jgi:cysteinyl-tRNA synthetase